MNVFGVDMDGNVPGWTNDQRRVGSLLAIGVAALLVLVGLVAFAFLGEDGGWLYWTLFGLLLLVLVYELAVVALGVRAESAAPPAPAGDAHAGPAAPGAWSAPAPSAAAAPETLTLRCGDCGTVFDVTDTGERPLYHSCPGCGAEGVLREPAAPAPEPAPPASSWARPAAEPAAPEPQPIVPRAVDEAPITPKPVASALKKLKLRCGGCKQVFAIDDTGERPLRNRCPHCGRMGEIK